MTDEEAMVAIKRWERKTTENIPIDPTVAARYKIKHIRLITDVSSNDVLVMIVNRENAIRCVKRHHKLFTRDKMIDALHRKST